MFKNANTLKLKPSPSSNEPCFEVADVYSNRRGGYTGKATRGKPKKLC
jgi:hypothetical protein